MCLLEKLFPVLCCRKILIISIAAIFFARRNNRSTVEFDVLDSKKQKDMTNYMARFHFGFEMIYPSSQKLHPAIKLQYNHEYTEQSMIHQQHTLFGAVHFSILAMTSGVRIGL